MTQGARVLNNTTTTAGQPTAKSMKKMANELEIGFLGINYDSNFGLDTEEEDIKKSGFKCSRSVLTIANFEKILIESPPIVHISTHGAHQDQKINKQNEFQIALEEKQILRYLLDEHPKYSAYYAAIAIFFEMEINHFVQYGIKHKNHTHPNNKGLKLCIALLQDSKINKIYHAILQCILDRFGCYYRENPIIGCIEIFWGKYEKKGFVPPYSPINQYQFAELYQNDRYVQQIYTKINAEYNEINGEHNNNNNIYKFNWKILSKLLSKSLHCIIDERRTQIKFGEVQELTRELKIVPININRYEYGSGEKLKKLIEKVSTFKNELVARLKQSAVIPIMLDFSSERAKNVHIIRFANKYSLSEATKEINKIKQKIDVHHDYDIQFRTISKADCDTKKQVGFMGKMQEKLYSVDIKQKSDPISHLIQKHLKSKKECKIKLLILNGCHSYILGKIFSEYVDNVICIHPFVKIWATTATTFTRHFYQALKQFNHSIPFSHAVLKSFHIAKQNVIKHCSNDLQCVSHSHSHPFCTRLHLNEDWKELQNHINDRGKYDQYRNKMNQFGVLMKEPMQNLYDNKSLKISNLSMQKMQELCQYLEREYELYDIDGKNNDKFVKEAVYRENEYYKDLGVAFIKLESESDRDAAMKILSQKQYNEAVMLSQQLLWNKDMDMDICMENLGWNCSPVHRCCCAPHHPHTVQDKFILLQNDQIINRQIIDDVSLTVDSKNSTEKEIQQAKLPPKKRQQTFQNDAYFGTFNHKPKKNNFDGNNDV